MTPSQAIAALDRQLTAHGQDVTLQRGAAGANGSVTLTTVTVRAFVREARPDPVIGAVVQHETEVTISPTQIAAAGWTNHASPDAGTDSSIPIVGNQVVIGGRTKKVMSVEPILMAGTVVRINMRAKGS